MSRTVLPTKPGRGRAKHHKRNGSIYSRMSRQELLKHCRQLYESDGLKALSYASLSKERGLYTALYRAGLSQKLILTELKLKAEYSEGRSEFLENAWDWNRVLDEASAVIKQQGYLPPSEWFRQNGMSSFVGAVYVLGRNWEMLRKDLNQFAGSSFIESRNGMRWRSHPEASLSNFLYARGVEHKKGEKYPDEFAEEATQNYGYYDLHFRNKKSQWVNVEIWGEKPNGADPKHYANKRREKEIYNRKLNKCFVGIEFRDCFNEERLTTILRRHIGTIEPYIFEKSYDPIIQPTHWSNADELIEYCREFASQQQDGNFPTEEWLRKRGKWAKRPGPAYNTLSIYIKTWLGGIRNLREILGQGDVSTTKWNRNTALRALEDWLDKYKATPDSVRADYHRGVGDYTHAEGKAAARLSSAIRKHVGNMRDAFEAVGYVPNR